MKNSKQNQKETQNVEQNVEQNEEKRRAKVLQTDGMHLNRIRNALLLSLEEGELNQYALQYGYPNERLQLGKKHYDSAEGAYGEQKKKLAEQFDATRTFYELQGRASGIHLYFGQVARIAFKNNPGILDKLFLRNRRGRSFGEWVVQTRVFYKNMFSIPSAVEVMGKFTVTKEALDAGEKLFRETLAAETRKQDAKAEAQKATEHKQKAFKRLKEWMRRYLNVMKVALEDDPQLKEKLGIITPSEE